MLVLTALGVGIVVGLTGMGGGALMTPALVLFFGVPPLTAVSSDLIASAAMKPVGSLVHMRRGTVHWKLVLWLMVGSVPTAFCGALIISAVGPLGDVSAFVKAALGVVLLIASAGLIVRAYVTMADNARLVRGLPQRRIPATNAEVTVRVVPTLLVGAVGGLMVGLTSVGSGSLIIVCLMALYPLLSANRLVGTDLVQAVPLVIAAAAGHLLFGDVDWGIVWPLIIGSVPGAFIGAQLSSRVPGGVVRRALALILLVAGFKLLGASNEATLLALVVAFVAGTGGWMLLRVRNGLSPLGRHDRRFAQREDAPGE
jgi:hypothetical protein